MSLSIDLDQTTINKKLIESFNNKTTLSPTISDSMYMEVAKKLEDLKQNALTVMMRQDRPPPSAKQLWYIDNKESIARTIAEEQCTKHWTLDKQGLIHEWQRVKKEDVDELIIVKSYADTKYDVPTDEQLYDCFVELNAETISDNEKEKWIQTFIKKNPIPSEEIDKLWCASSVQELQKYSSRAAVLRREYEDMCLRITTHVDKCFARHESNRSLMTL